MGELRITKTASVSKVKLTLGDLRQLVDVAKELMDSAEVSIKYYDGGYQENNLTTITVTERG